jgi:cell wall-associated NlpC family hydrolase
MKMRPQRHRNPARTEIIEHRGATLAVMTNGAYTVTSLGPRRTFTEATAAHSVTHAIWVRTLPAPFDGNVNTRWLSRALAANQARVPDVLAIAMQYIKGAAPVFEGRLQIAGDASYGPLKNGKREEGADFNDYLGVEWRYPDQIDQPEKRQHLCLDCSGLMRMVWGYRHHLPAARYLDTVPLGLRPRSDHNAIPRRAFEIFEAAPGVIIIPKARQQVTDFSALNIGDLVFFDADKNDGKQLDHVGIYFGLDSGGHQRFLSSRKGANGPTLGDYKGKSILDGTGLYARSFRAARRL